MNRVSVLIGAVTPVGRPRGRQVIHGDAEPAKTDVILASPPAILLDILEFGAICHWKFGLCQNRRYCSLAISFASRCLAST